MKRNNNEKRYVEFYYRTGTISFKMSKDDEKPTKSILASKIKEVRMLFDNPEDMGRAFNFSI